MHQLSQIERVCLADLYDLVMSGRIPVRHSSDEHSAGGRRRPAGILPVSRAEVESIGPDWNALDAEVDGRVILPSWRPAVSEPDVRQRREGVLPLGRGRVVRDGGGLLAIEGEREAAPVRPAVEDDPLDLIGSRARRRLRLGDEQLPSEVGRVAQAGGGGVVDLGDGVGRSARRPLRPCTTRSWRPPRDESRATRHLTEHKSTTLLLTDARAQFPPHQSAT